MHRHTFQTHKKDAPKAGDGNFQYALIARRLADKKDAPKAGDGNFHKFSLSLSLYKKDAPKAGDGNFFSPLHC